MWLYGRDTWVRGARAYKQGGVRSQMSGRTDLELRGNGADEELYQGFSYMVRACTCIVQRPAWGACAGVRGCACRTVCMWVLWDRG